MVLRSILTMKVEREELPWTDIPFESKTQGGVRRLNDVEFNQSIFARDHALFSTNSSTRKFFCQGTVRRPTPLWRPIGVNPNIGGCSRVTHLLLLSNATIVGIELDEGALPKMKYVLAAMTSSRLSGKSTYVSWLRFFYRGDSSRSDCIVEVCLSYWPSWYYQAS